MRISIAAAIACLLATMAIADPSEASIKKPVKIEPQNLSTALQEFAQERKLYLIYAQGDVINHLTSGASGELTQDEVLKQLLQGTGLTYKLLDSNTITIVPIATAAGATKSSSAALEKVSFRLAQSESMKKVENTTSSDDKKPDSSAEESGNKIQEIVVTAQKREERLIDIPMSVTAMSGEELTAKGIHNSLDLSYAVSSLSVVEVGPGKQEYIMRGIGSRRGTSSLAGIYLDEMPLSGLQTGFTPDGADVRAIDLQRVEVLKGPQGTLFGEGAAGGVIRFITNDPGLDAFGGDVSTRIYNTTDGGWSEEITGVANLPLVEDVLGIRIAAHYGNVSGWIDQPSIGRENINDSEVKHIRVKALFAPTPQLRIKPMIEVHRNDGGGSNVVNQEPREDSNFLQAFDRSGKTGYYDDYDLYNLTASYDFGFAELLSSTSHGKMDNVMSFTQLVDGDPRPWLEIFIPDQRVQRKFTAQELRLGSKSQGAFNWTIGAAYKDDELRSGQGSFGTSAYAFGGSSPFLNLAASEETKLTSKSWAAFASTSYAVSSRFEIGGGLRHFTDTRESSTTTLTITNPLVASNRYDKVTFRAYVKYQAWDEGNIYFNVGDGFRAGAPTSAALIARGAPADANGPEESIFYELGTKIGLFDSRLNINAALFYGEYNGMQENVTVTSPVDGGPLGYTTNAQDAEIKGFELDIGWKATDRLTLSMAGDITDSETVWVDPAAATPSFRIGDPVNLVPDYSLSLNANYRFNWLDSAPGFALLSFNRQGESTRSERGNILLLVRQVTAPELNFLNASVGAELREWELSLFGSNLLDEEGALNPAGSGWTAQARPRTIGIGVSKSF